MNLTSSQQVQTPHGATPQPHDCGIIFTPPKPGKLRRLPFVMEATGCGKSTIYAGVRQGTFPAPCRISARAVAWREEDIDKWVSERVTTGGKA